MGLKKLVTTVDGDGWRKMMVGVCASLSLLLFSGEVLAAAAAAASVAVASDATPFQVRSTAAFMGDIDSGAVLFDQDGNKRLPPASLTKVMTLYLVYEALSKGELQLDAMLPVSERAWRVGGSKTFVKVGDRVRVEDLILGIAVQSGNDACVVMAEQLAGSEAGFADMMNKKAQELGMVNTHFVNASGLPDPNHYTSARDLYLLASALMRNFPKYTHYSREKQYTFNGIQQYNRNRLLWRDPSVTGLKTGHTQEAEYCLIATNEVEGQRLAAVVLGSQSSKIREEEALRLLRYGNRTFETVRLFEPGGIVRKVHVWKGKKEEVEVVAPSGVVVTIPRKDRGALEVGLWYQEPLVAPLAEGEQVGSLQVKLGDHELMKAPVVAGQAVPSGNFFHNLMDAIRLTMGW